MTQADIEFRRKDWGIFNVSDPDSRVDIPSGTCLLAYRGSHAHGMFVPTTDPKGIDDVDLMGIVLGDAVHYLGLQEWGSRGTKEVKRGPWDVVFYEIRKMVGLLLQGNPNVLSMLWVRPQDILYSNAAGKELVANRDLFVGRHVYHSFAGYAHAQLEKMETRDPAELRRYMAVTNELKYRGKHPNREKLVRNPYQMRETARGEERDVMEWSDERLLQDLKSYQKKGENIGYMGDKRKGLVLEHGYDSKNAAHCIRLLRMCKEFLATGAMTVYRPDAAELLQVKRGEWELGRVKELATQLFEEIRVERDRSPLPPEPNRAEVERLTMQLVWDHLHKEWNKLTLTEELGE